MVQALEFFLSEDAIVRDLLHFEQATVGLKANFPELIEVAQALADVEIPTVIDRRLGAQCSALLVVLLHARAVVVDVQ